MKLKTFGVCCIILAIFLLCSLALMIQPVRADPVMITSLSLAPSNTVQAGISFQDTATVTGGVPGDLVTFWLYSGTSGSPPPSPFSAGWIEYTAAYVGSTGLATTPIGFSVDTAGQYYFNVVYSDQSAANSMPPITTILPQILRDPSQLLLVLWLA